jgi:biopolymer transport protein ExbD
MPLKTQHDDLPALNLTPMIDVVFNLIIFFMASTTFAQLEREIDLKVPEVSRGEALTEAPAHRVVNVFRDGRITLDREAVTSEQLTQRLIAARRQYAELGVLVRGDAQAVHQQMAEVLSACKRAGIQELGISVTTGTSKR